MKDQPLIAEEDLRPMLLAAVVVAAYAWIVPIATVLLTTGHVPAVNFFEVVIGTVRIAADQHWSNPAQAYPIGLGREMPGATAWWAIAAALTTALIAAPALVWLRMEPLRAASKLGRRPYDPRGAHPRSWARPRDLRANVVASREPDRFTIGRLDRRVIASGPESHVAVIAPTRSGKTSRCVIPWLLEHDGPAIVTSTKTDVLDATAKWRRQLGRVSIWDPFTPGSCGWTPIAGCSDWSTALQRARWITDCAVEGDSEVARYWGGEAAKLHAPLSQAADLVGQDMVDVLGWVDTKHTDTPMDVLTRFGADAAARQLAGVASLDDRNKGTTFMSLAGLLAAYRYPEVQSSNHPEFTPAAFFDGGANTLYIVANERHQTELAPLIVALVSSLLNEAAERANRDRPLQPTLRVLLDEAANIAPLRQLPSHLSQAAGHGIRIATIWQSIAQIQHRYATNADAILANSTTKLFMGPISDETTRQYVSRTLGEEPVGEVSPGTPHHRPTTQSRFRRPKADAEALRQLARDRALLLDGRSAAAVVRLTPWWNDRELRQRADD
jgi:type IV secretory pathway TraG/TraD family ATPase VirD4